MLLKQRAADIGVQTVGEVFVDVPYPVLQVICKGVEQEPAMSMHNRHHETGFSSVGRGEGANAN